jgi:hypothetical protein
MAGFFNKLKNAGTVSLLHLCVFSSTPILLRFTENVATDNMPFCLGVVEPSEQRRGWQEEGRECDRDDTFGAHAPECWPSPRRRE